MTRLPGAVPQPLFFIFNCFWLQYFFFKVVFHLKKIEVEFGFIVKLRLSLASLFMYKVFSIFKNLRLSSIFKKIEVIFHFQKNWDRLPFQNLGRLPFKKFRSSFILKILRSASIFKNMEVIFHIWTCWVKSKLHAENYLHGLPGTAQIVMSPGVVVVVVVWWWCGGVLFFLTDNNTTLTKVVLDCFGLLVGLW